MTISILKRGDPTRTIMLRYRFVEEIKLRFKRIIRLTNQSIIKNNCFGMSNFSLSAVLFKKYSWEKGMVPIPSNAFKFQRDPEKISSFLSWLRRMETAGIFQISFKPQVGAGIEPVWSNIYIKNAYKKGILWARHRIKQDSKVLQQIGKQQNEIKTELNFINSAFNQPVHADRVGVLYTRVFDNLKGITAAIDSKISGILSEGMSLGLSPYEVARNISKEITTIGINRSTVLARTEIIRAHHLAAVQEYRNYGIEGVKVDAEWVTAGDERVCELCSPLDGKIFTLDEIEGKIPVHPQCRCAAVPVVID